ncbi:MAG: bifunctional riboflavin kinase/FAD synthetase [Verrucomicrobiales bacterium]
MKRLAAIRELEGPVHLALGVFDGVHVGHQEVIRRAVQAAVERGGEAGVLTFDPYPLRVLAPDKAPRRLLASLDHKAEILRPLGVDLLLAVPFNPQQARVEAPDFVKQLVEAGARTIAAGEDWRFGYQRAGDRNLLRRLSAEYGFHFEAVPPVMLDGERVSSTRIRQAVRDGNLAAAARMLGRPYTVSGKIVEGQKLGRKLGFPTANLERGEEQYPPDGVWAVRVSLEGQPGLGVANLGHRPTLAGDHRTLEVHLFDETRDLYGRQMEVEFVEFLRGEEKFSSLDALKDQVGRDALEARARLGGMDP